VVPSPLPWSYGPSESVAVDAALSLWAVAGQPGLAAAAAEAAAETTDAPGAHAEAAESLHEIEEEAGTTVVAVGPDGETLLEHQVLESVNAALRAVIGALVTGVATVSLTRHGGGRLQLTLSSVVELRDKGPGKAAEEEGGELVEKP
jgi:hypothetical protein